MMSEDFRVDSAKMAFIRLTEAVPHENRFSDGEYRATLVDWTHHEYWVAISQIVSISPIEGHHPGAWVTTTAGKVRVKESLTEVLEIIRQAWEK